MYNCQNTYYYHSDTLQADTLEYEEDIMLDDEGNPIPKTVEDNEGNTDPANIEEDPFENL
jgi:hypothetical protein